MGSKLTHICKYLHGRIRTKLLKYAPVKTFLYLCYIDKKFMFLIKEKKMFWNLKKIYEYATPYHEVHHWLRKRLCSLFEHKMMDKQIFRQTIH